MIRSSESLMAEDVTIRCRIRRSQLAANPEFEEAQEMTCTMRNWESCRTAKAASTRPRAMSTPHPSRTQTPPNNHRQNNNNNNNGLSRSFNHHTTNATAMSGGPELLLTPIRELLSTTNREDESPIRRRRVSLQQAVAPNKEILTSYSIPISDVMIVDSSSNSSQHNRSTKNGYSSNSHVQQYSSANPSWKILITTFSCGLLDFQCMNKNGHDILMAFLKASLAPERIVDGSRHNNNHPQKSLENHHNNGDDRDGTSHNHHYNSDREDIPSTVRSSSSVTSCLDVDAFTAAHLQGRADRETWPEKVSRRMGKVVNSLSELSNAFCDFTWCLEHSDDGNDDAARDKPPSSNNNNTLTSNSHVPNNHGASSSSPGRYRNHQHHAPRRHTTTSSSRRGSTTQFHYSDLELDDQDSCIPTQGSQYSSEDNKKQQRVGSGSGGVGGANTTRSNNFDRRWNSLPNHMRLELARKSSC